MKVSMIAAVSNDWVIGANGKIPWHIPEDFKYFKEKTLKKTVIMGRKTFESMNCKALPNRNNIVVTSGFHSEWENVKQVKTLDSALELAALYNRREDDEVFIIGGSRLYEEGFKHADTIYITHVSISLYDAENNFAYFPKLMLGNYIMISGTNSYWSEVGKLSYRFDKYKKFDE